MPVLRYMCIYISICLFIYPSIYLSIYLSSSLSLALREDGTSEEDASKRLLTKTLQQVATAPFCYYYCY